MYCSIIRVLNLSGILHQPQVLKTVPSFLKYQQLPVISYTYTTTISTRIFNFKRVIKDVDFTVGTTNITCSCSSSPFKYAPHPVGHVITGNLNIRPLRMLLNRGPHFREQNNVNWIVNRRRSSKESWAKNESVDTRYFNF